MAAIFSGLEEDTYDRQYGDMYLMRRIASYIARYRWRLLVIGIGFLAVATLAALPAIFIAWGVDLLAENTNDSISLLTLLVVALLVAAVFQYFFNWARRRGLSSPPQVGTSCGRP